MNGNGEEAPSGPEPSGPESSSPEPSGSKPSGSKRSAAFDVAALARLLPPAAGTLISDMRLVDSPDAGLRLFRANGPVPKHLHRFSDEYLMVVQGRATFRIDDEPETELKPGQVVFFERGTWHGFPRLIEEPFVILAFEVPARDPADVVFFDRKDRPFIETTERPEEPGAGG